MERWDQRQGLPLRILVLEVLALKIGARLICAVEEMCHAYHPGFSFP